MENKVIKKCIFVTPVNVKMTLSNGTIVMPNAKTVVLATTGEILFALNSGIRVMEIVGDQRIKLDKTNYNRVFTPVAELEKESIVKEIEDSLKNNPVPVPVPEEDYDDNGDDEVEEEIESEPEEPQEDPEKNWVDPEPEDEDLDDDRDNEAEDEIDEETNEE